MDYRDSCRLRIMAQEAPDIEKRIIARALRAADEELAKLRRIVADHEWALANMASRLRRLESAPDGAAPARSVTQSERS